MTNTKTTKTNHYFRAAFAVVVMLAAMLVASGVAPAATTTFGNSSPIQILDNGPANPYPSQINVQNVSGNVSDVNLKLNRFTHEWPDDVSVLLVGPKGQKALVMSDTGGVLDPIDPATHSSGAFLTLDDEAANFLPDNDQLTSGSYKPTEGTVLPDTPSDCWAPANLPAPAPAGPYETNLSVFDGTDPNGTWNLYVLDDCGFQTGQIAGGWSLDITTGSTTPPPDPQPADTTAPRVVNTIPALRATGVSPTANVTATFSEDMDASTVNGATFKLFEKGSTAGLPATVTYDATTDRATLDPTNSLKSGITYKAVVDTGAKDLAGNALDQNPTKAGNQPKVWRFRVQ